MLRAGSRCRGEGTRLYCLLSLDALSCHWAYLALKTSVGSGGHRGNYQVLVPQPWGMVESLLRKCATNDFINDTKGLGWS